MYPRPVYSNLQLLFSFIVVLEKRGYLLMVFVFAQAQ